MPQIIIFMNIKSKLVCFVLNVLDKNLFKHNTNMVTNINLPLLYQKQSE